jgi:hypothetical protein
VLVHPVKQVCDEVNRLCRADRQTFLRAGSINGAFDGEDRYPYAEYHRA